MQIIHRASLIYGQEITATHQAVANIAEWIAREHLLLPKYREQWHGTLTTATGMVFRQAGKVLDLGDHHGLYVTVEDAWKIADNNALSLLESMAA